MKFPIRSYAANSYKKIKRFYRQQLFQGESSRIDRTIFYFFGTLDVIGKKLSPNTFRRWAYNRLINYLHELLPYDSAHPLLGSKKDEKLYLEYRKKRFLEVVRPCDVILVKGNMRISRIIQTLTHSPYSHSAFYRGNGELIEADPDGILISMIDKYIHLDIRICRPIMLTDKGQQTIIRHMDEMIKKQPQYDVTNIEKLLFKYIYSKFRPDLQVYIGGSTKFEKYYICSGLIAHGFHKAGYPIIPVLRFRKKSRPAGFKMKTVDDYFQWVVHTKKNFSQIVPADFDNSSFFASIKFLCIESQPPSQKRVFKRDF